MHSGPKKCKRDEMEQHEPGDAAGGQIISGLKVVASVYDACKDALWGLLDGEGCERFWSKLHHLISGLHVMGYHHRLFVLDMQIEHITAKKHFQLPRWLKEHLQRAESWLNSATEELGSQSIEELLSHFDSQHQHHSAPPGRQSKSAVRSLIESVMSLKATRKM